MTRHRFIGKEEARALFPNFKLRFLKTVSLSNVHYHTYNYNKTCKSLTIGITDQPWKFAKQPARPLWNINGYNLPESAPWYSKWLSGKSRKLMHGSKTQSYLMENYNCIWKINVPSWKTSFLFGERIKPPGYILKLS